MPVFLTELGGPQNLSFENMFELAVNQQIKPHRPAWDRVYHLILECSASRWQDRLSSYRTRKMLDAIVAQTDSTFDESNATSTTLLSRQ